MRIRALNGEVAHHQIVATDEPHVTPSPVALRDRPEGRAITLEGEARPVLDDERAVDSVTAILSEGNRGRVGDPADPVGEDGGNVPRAVVRDRLRNPVSRRRLRGDRHSRCRHEQGQHRADDNPGAPSTPTLQLHASRLAVGVGSPKRFGSSFRQVSNSASFTRGFGLVPRVVVLSARYRENDDVPTLAPKASASTV